MMNWDEGLIGRRDLGDGRAVWIQRQIFTWAICIGWIGADCYDDRWCYESFETAKDALEAWDPLKTLEPVGWHRNPRTGRRRPAGDSTKEYVHW